MYRKSKLLLAGVCICLTSCTASWQQLIGNNVRQGVSSSLVDFLYPDGQIPPDQDQRVPSLELPVRVGLAFVPSRQDDGVILAEAQKNDLLNKVKQSFADREFIRDIVVIPETYLRSGRGFQTVEQVARLYSLDVIALVSYDQVAHLEDTKSSILYWTIVGAYFVKGSKNDVQTFVDTAVFDVGTRKLLFRAAGVDHGQGTATLVNSAEMSRETRQQSFARALSQMTGNLAVELDQFRERIKQDKSVQITHSKGYGGGGALDGVLLALLGLLGLLAWRQARSARNLRT